jgi:hypothetical protein
MSCNWIYDPSETVSMAMITTEVVIINVTDVFRLAVVILHESGILMILLLLLPHHHYYHYYHYYYCYHY